VGGEDDVHCESPKCGYVEKRGRRVQLERGPGGNRLGYFLPKKHGIRNCEQKGADLRYCLKELNNKVAKKNRGTAIIACLLETTGRK